MVMGEKPTVNPIKQWNNALMNYVYCYPGTFHALKNFDDMVTGGYMHSYFTYKMPNSRIEKSTTSSDRVAGFLVVGDSQNDVKEKLAYINHCVKVCDASGQDIMRHDFFDS